MPTDDEVRARQKMRNRVTVILLLMFIAIIFALSFGHITKEQELPKSSQGTFTRGLELSWRMAA